MAADLSVLVVDDEPAVRQVLVAAINKAGYAVESAASAGDALAKMDATRFDVVLSDVFMPVVDGIELLKQARAKGHRAAFIMVTAFASVDSAIDAIRAGAYDYITKPVRSEEILHRLENIDALRSLRDDNRALRSLVLGDGQHPFEFKSPAMQEVDRLLGKVAPTDSTVLITGESGTGKGVAARAVHELSGRCEGRFVSVNCSAIPENLLESELFGHVKGAFTSADRTRKGLFLEAHGGTIFLDEIGELPLAMQTKLLHVIESREVRAVGAEQNRRTDVRIIAATNRDIAKMVADGTFREDLFFRLAVFQVHMPPLRERRADIPALMRHLVARQGQAAGTEPLDIDPEAEDLLVHYDWPGNVRQLENVLHRAAILADGGRIRASDLPPEVSQEPGQPGAAAGASANAIAAGEGTLRERVRRFEVSLILRAIEECGGDRRAAAARLSIGLSSLYRKLEEFQGEAGSA